MGIKVGPGRCKVCLVRTGLRQRYCPSHRPSKYRSKRTSAVVDGAALAYASRKECRRHADLLLLQGGGHIANLRSQVSFPLVVSGHKVCTYVADFVYLDLATGEEVVEDAKGYRTSAYRIKAKLFAAIHGKSIREV